MRAEALSDSIEVPTGLGVMQAEALSDSMEAPAGLGADGLKPSLTTWKLRWSQGRYSPLSDQPYRPSMH